MNVKLVKLTVLVAFFTEVLCLQVAASDQSEDAIKLSIKWKFALAKSVKQQVHDGERNPRMIAETARKQTQAEERIVWEIGKNAGVSDKDLEKSIRTDREQSLSYFIKEALDAQHQRTPGAKPIREKGISLYLIPKKEADEHAKEGARAGIIISRISDRRPLNSMPTVQTVNELMANLKPDLKTLQQNGLWMIIPHDSLNKHDKQLLADLEDACRGEHIPLFVKTELDGYDKWQRAK